MSIEERIEKLTVAIETLTAALGTAVKPAATSSEATQATAEKKSRAPRAPKDESPKVTVEDACAVLEKIKNEHGISEARAVLNACGLEKMAGVDAKNAEKVLKAAEAKLAELAGAGEEADDDGL